jgi:hypothetical protein
MLIRTVFHTFDINSNDMKRAAVVAILLFDCFLQTRAQAEEAKIVNIRTEMTERALVIRYHLASPDPKSLHEVFLTVVDNRGNAVRPDSVYGDLGTSVAAGPDKTITWEIYKEFDVVYGNFTPVLTLDPASGRKHAGGPEYAALSLLVPGLGDYFVADPKNLVIKPWQKTAFTAGMLGLSWLALNKRVEVPAVVMPPGWYYYYPTPDASYVEQIYIDHEWVSEPARTEYWLFNHDAEIIFGIGIASWLFDAIWVTRKGVVNNRVRRSVFHQTSLIPARGGFYLTYTITF